MAPETEFEIPKTCKAGVVMNEGPDFKVVVEDVPVPEPGRCQSQMLSSFKPIAHPKPSFP